MILISGQFERRETASEIVRSYLSPIIRLLTTISNNTKLGRVLSLGHLSPGGLDDSLFF